MIDGREDGQQELTKSWKNSVRLERASDNLNGRSVQEIIRTLVKPR